MSSSNPNSSFHGKMGLQSLRSSLVDMLFAGAETTSTVLNWALLILTKYPHIQEKVQDELDQVCGRERLPNLDDRSRLHYTDAVIHEILRYIGAYLQIDPNFGSLHVEIRPSNHLTLTQVYLHCTIWSATLHQTNSLDVRQKVLHSCRDSHLS